MFFYLPLSDIWQQNSRYHGLFLILRKDAIGTSFRWHVFISTGSAAESLYIILSCAKSYFSL